MSDMNPTEAGRIADDAIGAGLPGVLNNLRALLAPLDVAAYLAGVSGVLMPVVVRAVQDAVKDPEVQARMSEAGKLLFRPRED